MEIGSSAFASQGTVANSTTPYYIPSGANLDFSSVTVGDLAVTNNASIQSANINVDLIVNDTIYCTRLAGVGSVSNDNDIRIETATGNLDLVCNQGGIGIVAGNGINMTTFAGNATFVTAQFGLGNGQGTPILPITIADTEPYTMITSKGYFVGQAGMTNYVFNVASANNSPFAIIQPIGNSPSNVAYWENTAPSVITVYGTGGGIPRFSMIIL